MSLSQDKMDVLYTCNVEEKLSTGNEACRRGHHSDFLYGCCSIFHRSFHGLVSKSIHQLLTSILCRACQYYELSASLLELEWSSSTSLHAHTLLPALSWMNVEGNLCSFMSIELEDKLRTVIFRASQLASRPGWKPSAWTRAAPCHKAFQKVKDFLLNHYLRHISFVSMPWGFLLNPYLRHFLLFPNSQHISSVFQFIIDFHNYDAFSFISLLINDEGLSRPSIHPCLSLGHYYCLGPCCRGWLWYVAQNVLLWVDQKIAISFQ